MTRALETSRSRLTSARLRTVPSSSARSIACAIASCTARRLGGVLSGNGSSGCDSVGLSGFRRRPWRVGSLSATRTQVVLRPESSGFITFLWLFHQHGLPELQLDMSRVGIKADLTKQHLEDLRSLERR